MSEFRHTLGDALYDLFTDYDGQLAERVLVYPVVRVTPRYVYVNGPWFYDNDRVYQFSREDLEVKGRAWNQKWRLSLRVRPMPDWPILLVSNERANLLTVGGQE